MLSHKFVFGFLLLSFSLALPFGERNEDSGTLLPRGLPIGKIATSLTKSLVKSTSGKIASEVGKSAVKSAPAKPPPGKATNAPANPTPGKTNNAKPTPGKATDKPAKSTTDKATGKKSPVVQFTGNSVESQARKANNAPGRTVPTQCKKLADCHCPTTQSTSCLNGVCSCNNSVVNFLGKEAMGAFKAIGNAPTTKAVGQVMKTMADVKEVASTVAGAVFGPEAKYATKVAMLAMPDVGPSHIDDITNGLASKILR